jgi:hypothetical protein
MKNAIAWCKVLGVTSIMLLGAAGCGNGESGDNGGVSNSIKSPVMDKEDDKKTAGGDNSTGNAATGNAAGNTATNSAAGKKAGSTTVTGGSTGGNTAAGNTATKR